MAAKRDKRTSKESGDFIGGEESVLAPANPLLVADDALKNRRWCRDEAKLPASEFLICTLVY